MIEHNRWMLPDGVEELLPPRAAAMEQLRRELLDHYRSRGYDMVTPPLIEYLESLLTGTGNDLDLQTFKLTDQLSGRLMGVRADITPQVARMDAHRLGGDGVRRLCYIGTVLHTRPGGFAGSRCPHQAGAELFGYAGVEADLEVLDLMLQTLRISGLGEVHLDLGHVGIYRALMKRAGLDAELEARLFDIMQRKAVAELEAFLDEGHVSARLRPVVRALPELNGDHELLAQARKVLEPAGKEVLAGLDQVVQAVDWLKRSRPGLAVHLDLAELHGYRYHTGLVFAAFQPGHGRAIARGGRYDHVGEVFGRARPATGFSADLQNLLLLGDRDRAAVGGGIVAPAADDPALAELISELRGQGERVIRLLPDEAAGDHAPGCDRQLLKTAQGWRVEKL